APALDSIADVIVLEDALTQQVALTGISTGPANEAAQTLSFTATSSNVAVVPAPTISYASGTTGTLAFAPAGNANGSTTITVTLRDSGGTASGGVDTLVRTFTLTVAAVNDAPTLDPIEPVTVLEDAGVKQITLTG